MIEIENRATMHAPAETVFRLAAHVEQWPHLLAHYRRVTLLASRPEGLIVEMSAVRPPLPLPVRWRAIQTANGGTGSIRYRHIGGVTRGMDVEWRIVSAAGTTEVTIVHRFAPPWPWPGAWIARRIVCGFFVHAIAERTLTGIAYAAEHDDALDSPTTNGDKGEAAPAEARSMRTR